MRKWMLTLLVAIFALPFYSTVVLAEEANEFEDGEYKIEYEVKKEKEDVTSAADGFMTKPAILKVENGNQYIELELTSSSWIKWLTVNNDDVDGISSNEEKDTRIVGFEVEGDLSEPVLMEMHVNVPGAYESTHKARAFFDVSEVPVEVEPSGEIAEGKTEGNGDQPPIPEDEAEAEEGENGDPSPTNEEEDGDLSEGEDSDTEAPSNDAIEDGVYQIDFVSESEQTNKQFNNPATLIVEDGIKYIQMSGSSGQFIKSLAINGDEVTWGVRELDGQFVIQFEVEGALSEKLDFDMVINAFGNIREYEVGLSFDENSLETVENGELTIYTESLPFPEDPEKEKEKEEKPTEYEEPVVKVEKKNEPKNEDLLIPDRAHEIGFVIKYKDDDEVSAADHFFVSPAILLYKGNEKYLQVTVTDSHMIESLKTLHGDNYIDMVLVKENEDGSIVVQFKVDGEISDMIELKMSVSVPGVYEETHKARLFLDENSMTEVDVSAYRLAASANDNGPTVDGVSGKTVGGGEIVSTPSPNNSTTDDDDKAPEKPEFGPGEGNDELAAQAGTAGQETNPKTGDTSNIMLYALLLIGSAIPLAIQLKRRFV